MSDLSCPNCGHPEFYCQGTISASLIASLDGELDYQLRESLDLIEIEYFTCPNCNFSFCGDEEEFLEFLYEELPSTVVQD